MMRRRPKGSRYRAELVYHVVREGEPAARERLDSPELVVRWADAFIPDDDREHFVVAFLDSQNQLIAGHHVSTGSTAASIVHPANLFRAAILGGAVHLVLAHNHPSGDPTPSKEDLHLTRQLQDGAKLLGLRIHDHVITGRGAHVSLAARGMMP